MTPIARHALAPRSAPGMCPAWAQCREPSPRFTPWNECAKIGARNWIVYFTVTAGQQQIGNTHRMTDGPVVPLTGTPGAQTGGPPIDRYFKSTCRVPSLATPGVYLSGYHIVARARSGQARSYSSPPQRPSVSAARICPLVGMSRTLTNLSGFHKSARTRARAHWK